MNMSEYTKETLRGLPGVVVIIEGVKQDAQADGLNVSILQTEVEKALQDADIQVLSFDVWRKTRGRPWLYISVNTIKYLSSYFFSLDVQLKQDVGLVYDPDITTSSATWEAGSIGFINMEALQEKIRESVTNFVDQFILAYKSANSE